MVKVKKEYLILFAIIALGVFLRVYHHHDWLDFQSDQSRDALIVGKALEGGVESFPLHGPMARGTQLFLGPVFYYFQIASAYLSGDYPNKLAWPDLLFSILTIPLFYFLSRGYFSKPVSLGLTALASVSLFFVEYSRFAWNPNSLPFFMALMACSLLKAFDNSADGKVKTGWLIASVISLGIATQLHFVAFFSAPLIFLAFLIYKRPRIKLKQYAVSILILLAFYSPLVFYGLKSDKGNSQALIEAVEEKQSKDENKNIFEKFFRNVQETSRIYWVLITSDQHGKFILTKFDCDKECRKDLPFTFAAFASVLAGFAILLYKLFTTVDRSKRDFLFLVLAWLVFPFLVLIPVAFQISPRFFLVTAIPAVILFGLPLEAVKNYFKKTGIYITLGILTLVLGINIVSVLRYFKELNLASSQSFKVERDLILLKDERVTLGQLEKIADYISSENNGKVIEFIANARYGRSIGYLIQKRGEVSATYFKEEKSFMPTEEKTYFAIEKTLSKNQIPAIVLERFSVTGEKEFGTLTVFRLEPKS